MIRRALLLTALLAGVTAPAAAQVRLHGEGPGAASLGVVSWRDIPFRTVLRQQFDYSCGSAALATLLTFHYDRPTTEQQTFQAMFASGDQAQIRRLGFSLLDMKRYAEAQGFQAEGYRITLAEIAAARAPVIALIQVGRYRHFVVIKGVENGRVLVGDPSAGASIYTAAEFTRVWNGVVLAISAPNGPAPGFNRIAEWQIRGPAPFGLASAALPASALTNELAPLYQITPVRDVSSQAFR